MSGKIAWITGGGSGIGRALAEKLGAEGWRVVISGRRSELLAKAADEIQSKKIPGEIWPLAGDASATGFAPAAAQKINERWGEIDLLVNNAGVNPNKSFLQTSPEEYLENFQINCMSAIRCTQAVLPAMRKKGSGAIVNISSVLGKWAAASSPAYSVSKYAVAGFNDVLRQELTDSGIHVLGVYPGFIRTAMTAPFVKPGSMREKVGKSPDALARAILNGLRRKKIEVNFPAYVPVLLGLYRIFPRGMEKLRKVMGH